MVNNQYALTKKSRSYLVTTLMLSATLATARLTIAAKAYADSNIYNWTKQGSVDPLGGSNAAVASSADGSSLIVGTNGGGTSGNVPGPLYVSSNYGATWQNVAENADSGVTNTWQSVAVSDNGQTMVAASSTGTNLSTSSNVNGGLYISHDGGNTWTNISPSGPNNWTNVAISGDGTKIVAVANDDLNHVYESTDSGQNWTTSAVNETVGYWESISISDNGSKVLVGGENQSNYSSMVDISIDGGTTWQSVSPDNGNLAFESRSTMSSNGDEIAVTTFGYSSTDYGSVYISNDNGNTWNTVTPDSANVDQWNAVSLSGNGQYLAVANTNNNAMFISSNDGSSWNQEDPDQAYSDANTNSWNSIAVNENGTHVIAASAANVYTGFDTTLENNSQTFANTGNGQTIALTTPSGTNVTCHSITSASSLSVADTGYSYPLGLVDFCFNNAQESNKITLTFVTNLTPSQVVLRFYNSSTKQYSTITDAVITETSYNGQPALQVSYYIPDNGLLDTDANFGTISDPVGLAVAENSTTIKAPDTGYGTTNNKAINITTLLATVSLSAGLVINNLRRKIKQ